MTQVHIGNYPSPVKSLKFGQAIVRNSGITQLVEERAAQLGSGVQAGDIVRSGVRVIFRGDEEREPEYQPGAIFR